MPASHLGLMGDVDIRGAPKLVSSLHVHVLQPNSEGVSDCKDIKVCGM